MGFLTRWIAAKMEDPAEREEKWVKHMRETDAKCDELCVARPDAFSGPARAARGFFLREGTAHQRSTLNSSL